MALSIHLHSKPVFPWLLCRRSNLSQHGLNLQKGVLPCSLPDV